MAALRYSPAPVSKYPTDTGGTSRIPGALGIRTYSQLLRPRARPRIAGLSRRPLEDKPRNLQATPGSDRGRPADCLPPGPDSKRHGLVGVHRVPVQRGRQGEAPHDSAERIRAARREGRHLNWMGLERTVVGTTVPKREERSKSKKLSKGSRPLAASSPGPRSPGAPRSAPRVRWEPGPPDGSPLWCTAFHPSPSAQPGADREGVVLPPRIPEFGRLVKL